MKQFQFHGVMTFMTQLLMSHDIHCTKITRHTLLLNNVLHLTVYCYLIVELNG